MRDLNLEFDFSEDRERFPELKHLRKGDTVRLEQLLLWLGDRPEEEAEAAALELERRGVDLDVSASEIEVMNRYIREYNRVISYEDEDTDVMDYSDAGYTHLNGKQALAYCRVRYVGNGDFDRTGRQREVMDLIIQKCKSMSVSDLNKLAETVLPWLTTDLSATGALSLASAAILNGYYKYDIQSIRIPGDETWDGIMVDGMSVLSIDFDANRDLFFETVYGKSYDDMVG